MDTQSIIARLESIERFLDDFISDYDFESEAQAEKEATERGEVYEAWCCDECYLSSGTFEDAQYELENVREALAALREQEKVSQ